MSEDTIRVLDRAIDILQVFSFEEDSLSLTEICSRVHLPKTTVFRIIGTLEGRNILIQDTQTGKFRLGYELIKLGAEAQNGNELSKVAQATMESVSLRTRQTCNLYVRDGFERVCIAQVMGSEYVRRYSYLGAHYPLYCGAGKILLAFEHPSFQENFFSSVTMERFTDRTVTSPEQLKKELAEIRDKRYSVSLGERDPFTAMVAVPLYNYTGRVIAALTISGPIFSFNETNIQQYLLVLEKEAQVLSAKLGYAG